MLLNSLAEVRIILIVLLEEADLDLADQHGGRGHQGARAAQVRDGCDLAARMGILVGPTARRTGGPCSSSETDTTEDRDLEQRTR